MKIVLNGKFINVEDKVEVSLIDKRTGKVVKREVSKNVLGRVGSAYVMYAFYNPPSIPQKPCNCVTIYDTAKNVIKTIEGSLSEPKDTGMYWEIEFTAIDDSTDEYTFMYLSLHRFRTGEDVCADVDYGDGELFFKTTDAMTKSADTSLSIRWVIRVPYKAPP